MPDSAKSAPASVGRFATGFVSLTGLASLAVGAVGNFTHENAATNIAFVIVGIAAVVIAPLLPRLQKFKVSPTGASADFGAAEKQIEQGQMVDAEKVVGTSESAAPEGELAPDDVQLNPAGRPVAVHRPRVFLTTNALTSLDLLTANERRAVDLALRDLGKTADPQIVESGLGARSYFVRRVGNVGVFYRQLDKTTPNEPDRYAVLDIKAAA